MSLGLPCRCCAIPCLALLLLACPGEVDVRDTGAGEWRSTADGGKIAPDQGPKKDKAPPKKDIGPKKDTKPKQDLPPPKKDLPPPKKDLPPTKKDFGAHDVGKACTGNSQCMFGLCAQNTHTGKWFCTKKCDPCQANPCPTGSGCQNAGLMYICAPNYPNAKCPKP